MIVNQWRECANIRTGHVVSALMVDDIIYQFARTIFPEGLVHVRPGDYLVAYHDGVVRVFSGPRFERAYYFTERNADDQVPDKQDKG